MTNEREILGLPWGRRLEFIHDANNVRVADVSRTLDYRDKADFIIRAANCHHELVEALEAFVAQQNGPPLVRDEAEWRAAMNLAEHALKKAGGVMKHDYKAARWQPIETAPRDGTEIVIATPLKWDMDKHYIHQQDERVGIGFCISNCWFVGGRWQNRADQFYAKPTHWMPLPQPPEEAK